MQSACTGDFVNDKGNQWGGFGVKLKCFARRNHIMSLLQQRVLHLFFTTKILVKIISGVPHRFNTGTGSLQLRTTTGIRTTITKQWGWYMRCTWFYNRFLPWMLSESSFPDWRCLSEDPRKITWPHGDAAIINKCQMAKFWSHDHGDPATVISMRTSHKSLFPVLL